MKHSRRTLAVAVAGALVLAAALGYSAWATATRMAPPPVTVATVDIINLVDKLTEKSDWDMQINALVQRIQAEHNERKKAIDDLTKQAEAAAEPEKTSLRDKIHMATIELQKWTTIKLAEVDRERALMWMALYRSIRTESAKLAASAGYDLILVNDGVPELQLQPGSRVPQEQQAQEQMMRRRVLFASNTIDVTATLILRMNNARSTVGTTPAAPPANPDLQRCA